MNPPSIPENGQYWLRLARSLLIPTLFAAVDPDGERARCKTIQLRLKEGGLTPLTEAALDAILTANKTEESHGEAPSDELQPGSELYLWRQCICDAWELQIPTQPDQPQDTALHPLSGEKLGLLMASSEVPAAWAELWDKLQAHLPRTSTEASWQPVVSEDFTACPLPYRKLWQALMEAGTATIPASPMLPDHSSGSHRHLTAALLHARRVTHEAGAEAGETEPGGLCFFHVGPVQSFISSSRRMHDLKMGSYLVAYLTWQAVQRIALTEGPQALIYPALEKLPLAEAFLFEAPPPDRSKLLNASIANRFLCVLPQARVQKRVQEAAQTVRKTWLEMGAAVRKGIETECPEIPRDWWDGAQAQLEAHLEIDASFLPWDAPSSNPRYGERFNLAQRTLTAHRQTVLPTFQAGDHRPKCVQCGRREQLGPCVNPARHQQSTSRKFWQALTESIQWNGGQNNGQAPGEERTSLQLNQGEALCAVCLTKRFAPRYWFGAPDLSKFGLDWNKPSDRQKLRFPSLETIASGPFRRQVLKAIARDATDERKQETRTALRDWLKELANLNATLDFTPPGSFIKALGRIEVAKGDHDLKCRLLEQEGSWLDEDAYEPLTVWRDHFPTEPTSDSARYRRIQTQAREAGKAFRKLSKVVKAKASPYLALVMMDGDSMGQWLSGELAPNWADLGLLGPDSGNTKRPLSPSLHRELSHRQGSLAVKTMRDVVEQHLGFLFYSGGDDLLATFPLQTLFPALSALNDAFRSKEGLGNQLTFSAGVSIWHSRAPFQEALTFAREAEHQAKDAGKNCVSLHVDVRAGAPLELTLTWEQVAQVPGLLEQFTNRKQHQQKQGEPDLDIAQQALLELNGMRGRDTALTGALAEAFVTRLRYLMFGKIDGKNPPPQEGHTRAFLGICDGHIDAKQLMHRLWLLRFLYRERHDLNQTSLTDGPDTNADGRQEVSS